MRGWAVLSFIALVRATAIHAIEADQALGCETLFTWHGATVTAPVYLFLHCPDTAIGKVQSDGTWSPGHGALLP